LSKLLGGGGGVIKIYCDGSGWNGLLSKFGVKTTEDSLTVLFHKNMTVNQMEYSAIVLAATIAEFGDELFSDSQLAVQQINGEWKVKDAKLLPLRMAATALIQGKNLKLNWIPRVQNKADKIV